MTIISIYEVRARSSFNWLQIGWRVASRTGVEPAKLVNREMRVRVAQPIAVCWLPLRGASCMKGIRLRASKLIVDVKQHLALMRSLSCPVIGASVLFGAVLIALMGLKIFS